jgi:hypothetical protein
LFLLATVATAQPATVPTSLPDSLLETASLQPTMTNIAARCVQLSPDQKDVFDGAYQGWLQRNFNEVQFANSRSWDFASRLAPHMRLIESRFVKPS